MFLYPEINLFLWNVFISRTSLFFLNTRQSNARAGQKKTHVFLGNARPKSNARSFKTEKKYLNIKIILTVSYLH